MRMVWRVFGLTLVMAGLTTSMAAGEQRIDFDTEVMPVLTLHGCNAGSCHGAALGRGGFKLSLLGSNPAADHDAMVRHMEGRRVNLARPDRSLVLLKPSEQVGHEGGEVMPVGSAGFDLVHRWLTEGARRDGTRNLVDLVISPPRITFEHPGESVSVRVNATFDDGSSADVTRWTVFQTPDPDAVTVASDGELMVHRRGIQIVIARFLDRVMPIRLTVPMQAQPLASETKLTERNPIDRFINDQLQRLRLPASAPADDWRFLRRVTLDLTGRLPTVQAARQFVADTSADKRRRLVDDLLQSESFADYWALKWANYLGIDSKQLQPEGAGAYHHWLRQQLAIDAPWNQTAIAMLTGTGDSYEKGALNFLRSAGSPGELAERTGRALMGVRLQCANCHDHPLDHWKQDDYHGLAAIFAKLDRQRVVSVTQRGEVTHPVTGQAAIPRIPGDRFLDEGSDGRLEFANWLTDSDNPYFATAVVNHIWQQLMGRGLVDPVDDLRATNPATHPELLRWLAKDFVTHGYSVRHTIQSICDSTAYARDSAPVAGNESDLIFYSHALEKPLEAEVVADAIAELTGVPLRFNSEPLPRSVTLTDNRMAVPGLEILGRCDREAGCNQAGSSASLARSLHLINGELINERVTASDGRLAQWLATSPNNATLLDQIFLASLAEPNASQRPFWQQELNRIEGAGADARRAFFEDVLWGVLTSRAFMTNR